MQRKFLMNDELCVKRLTVKEKEQVIKDGYNLGYHEGYSDCMAENPNKLENLKPSDNNKIDSICYETNGLCVSKSEYNRPHWIYCPWCGRKRKSI